MDGKPPGRLWPAAVLVALVLAAAAAAFVWQRYAATPQYATLKAFQAMSDRDWAAFTTWVDVPSVLRGAIAAESSETVGGLILRTVPAAREPVERVAELELRRRVESGVPQVPPHVPFAFLLLGGVVRGASIDGDDAYVTAESAAESPPLVLDLRLRRTAGRWRVVEVRNAPELLSGGR